MRALYFDGGDPRVEELPVPDPGPGEARVRVRLAGICATDLHIVRGYMGFRGVLGHEFVGEVVEHPDPDLFGARVCGEINLGCGGCDRCRRGLSRHCGARTVLGILGKDGCFAEHLTLPVGNLHRVPDAVPDERAVFAEPLAAAFEILEQVHVEPGDRVAVLGDGKLGSLCARVLVRAGCDVTLVGRHRRKLALAARAGARTATADDLLDGPFDLVVEATGSPGGFAKARGLLRPRGTLVLKSTYHGAVTVDAAPLVIDEITIVGSRCGPFAPALRALEAGLDPTDLIDATYPLEEGVAALEHAARPGAAKVLLAPG